ncbi:MAG TPA: methyltransferase, partial [Candidatus Limivivens merdigallinarum]|nr:methyltransferase [Candidatus Limivivens merdigallinarum]
YIDIAKSHGKKMFMHSDGNILSILPKLIEIGLDAVNTQVFCMDFEELSKFRGKITFWGEIDRQMILPYGTPKEAEDAVEKVMEAFWQDGGVIAQLEFGLGAKPENVRAALEKWNTYGKE